MKYLFSVMKYRTFLLRVRFFIFAWNIRSATTEITNTIPYKSLHEDSLPAQPAGSLLFCIPINRDGQDLGNLLSLHSILLKDYAR